MTTLPPLNCDGCRACCLGDTVPLHQQDNPALYKTKLGPDGVRYLAKGKDGNCVYLGKRGCQIQTTKPAACRIFDCRLYALAKRGSGEADPERLRAISEGEKRLRPIGLGAH